MTDKQQAAAWLTQAKREDTLGRPHKERCRRETCPNYSTYCAEPTHWVEASWKQEARQ